MRQQHGHSLAASTLLVGGVIGFARQIKLRALSALSLVKKRLPVELVRCLSLLNELLLSPKNSAQKR